MGFTRRYTNQPSPAQIGLIEGVVIVDQPAPGAPVGVGTGTVAIIGEFQDMTYALAVDKTTGVFSTSPQPVQIFSAADSTAKLGGFDETLGDFGNSGGNGFVKIRNKTFSSLVAVPVNLASQYGVRVVRKLPTNTSATVPTPAVPMSAAQVAAGTEFKSGTDRLRIAQKVLFTGDAAYLSGTDGATTSASSAATQTFSSAGAGFVANGVEKGDILVLGVIGAAGAQGSTADTYRVTAVTDATDIVVEKMDGSSFSFATGSSLAWRIHTGTTADSFGTGGAILDAAQQQYLVPARPLDANISASTVLTPTVAQPAPTATSWSPLSGLEAITGGQQVAYTSTVQAPNSTTTSQIETLYSSAINGLLANQPPSKSVSVVFAARTSSAIRSALRTFVDTRSAQGRGVTAVLSPPLRTENSISTQSTSNVLSSTAPGVGALRDERVDYCWPGSQENIPEAVGFSLGTADGGTTADGNLDITSDALAASILSNLSTEQDPAQTTQAVSALTTAVTGFQRGAPALGINDYIALKAGGVMGLRQEDDGNFYFQSGVTTSLTSGQTDINRRRFADEVEDSLAQLMNPYAKLNLTNDLRDTEVGQVVDYFDGLLAPNDPAAQRIQGYLVDDQSGNTPSSLAAGYNTIITKARMLPEQKEIVFQVQVGPNVIVTSQ